MRTVSAIFILMLILITANLRAQVDERESGIYAITGEKAILLDYTRSHSSVSTGNPTFILPLTLAVSIYNTHTTYHYKPESSGIEVSDTFVLVVGYEKTVYINDPFTESMTPNDLLLLPLTVNSEKHRREYFPGTSTSIGGVVSIVDINAGMAFEWERISENSFEIHTPGLPPGEYGFILRREASGQQRAGFNFSDIYDFTIPER